MEESVGMAVAMNEVLQDAGRSGNALKSISAGMAGLTVSAKDGSIQLTKAGMAMKEIAGIEVWNQKTGEIKDMYEVMDELSVKWDDLSEAEQTALGTSIAGKTQLTAFSALLSNWETAKQYVAEYKQGLTIGSAEKENAQYIDSIAGKWNVVKENMKAVGNTLVTSDIAKGFLDGLIVATDGLDGFTKHATSTFSDIFSGSLSKNWSDGIYETLEKTFGGFGGFTELGNKIATTVSDIFGGVGGKLLETTLERMSSFGGVFGRLKDIVGIFDKGTSLKELTNTIDERTDNINAIETEINSLKNQKQAMDELMPTYDELSKKENRSAKENQELAKMREQLADINPDLVLGYDQDGSPILKNLKLQSKELEAQIKLKQQSQRIEENALAMDTLEKRTKEQKDYNKALKEYNEMSLVSPTKRKEGLFGEEDLSDYAKRLKKNNEEITKSNEEAYQKRLEAHQQYVIDENAIQEKYLNQLEQNMSFKNLTDEGKESLLTFADALDWSNFSLAEGNTFTNQLSNLGEKITNETKNMGEFSKAITKIGEDYANGKTNLIDYTKALGEQYELAGKFDTESFTTWQQGLQSYVNMTGDLNGMNKAIDSMATSLNKVTGIDVSTWKTALSFDPAPIDASNKALQKFLNNYGTGIQNLGKGGLADTLTSQFETLQTSYTQMVSDLASGKEIDVEYLVNAKVNQPEPIGNLIDEIIADNKVTEKEIEILLNAQAELLNTGEISQETIAQIAEEFNMTEAEVVAMLNVKTEVKETGEPFEQIKNKWDNFEAGEKILTLIQNAVGGDVFQLAKTVWDDLDIGEKVQSLIQKASGSDLLQKAKSAWEGLSVGEKIQSLVQKVVGGDLIKNAGDWFMGLFEGEKTQTLTQKATGKEEVESASQAIEKLPSKKEVTISIVQAGANLLSGIGDFISSLGKKNEQTVTVKAKVGEVDTSVLNNIKAKDIEINAKVGKVDTSALNGIKPSPINVDAKVTGLDQINSLKSSLASIQNKTVTVTASGNALSQINAVKTALAGLQSKSISVSTSVNGTSQVNALKTAIAGLQGKSVSVSANTSGTGEVNALTSAINTVQGKTVSVVANVSGTSAVNALTSAINKVKSKSVKISASVSGTSAVQGLASAIASVRSKTVSVKVNRSIVTTESTVKENSIGGTPLGTSLASTFMNVNSTANSVSASDSSSVSFPVTAMADNDFGGTLDKAKILSSLDFNISHIKDLEEALERINNTLDVFDKKAENAFGQQKISLLQQQIPLLKEQQAIQEQIAKNERAQNNELEYWLSQKGFQFDNLGNITNYNDKLLSMSQNVEDLKEKYDALNDASKDNKNEEAIKKAQKAYEGANEELSKTKEYLEEYFTTNNKEILEASSKWWEYENQIRDVEKAIRDVINLPLNNEINAISDQIDFLDAKIDVLSDNEKPTYLIEQNALYREQQGLLHQLAEQMRGQLSTLDQNSEEYVELQSEIVELSTKWWELEGAIKDTNLALEELNRKNKLTPLENSLQETEYLLDRHSDRLDLIDAQYKNATGAERVEYLNKRYGILNEQLQATEQAFNRIKQLQWAMIPNLNSFGFTIDENGLIGNYDEILNNLVGKDSYEQAKEYADEYMELVRGDLIDIQVEAFETQNALKDVAKETYEAFEEAREEALEPYRNSLQEIEYLLDRHSDRIDLIDAQYENSEGAEKIEYLNKKYGILNEQLLATEESFNRIKQLQWAMIPNLNSFGFTIDENGLIGNYDEILNNLVGKDSYESAKKYADEYMELVRGDLIDIQVETFETQNALKEVTDEIEKLTREHQLFVGDLRLTLLNHEYEELSNNLDIISNKMEYAYGTDKINLIRQSIVDLNKQLDIQKERIETTSKQMSIYQSNLDDYGFEFDINGAITNYEKIMKYYQDTEDIEKLKDLTEEYFDLQADELPSLIAGYSDLEKEIKDMYREQLEITQDIEGEITEIIKKEYERRKKELEEYTDEHIKLLDKQKKAYQELREEQDYEANLKEQTDKIEELQRRIETARKDTSISGQKRLSELLKELEEAQKNLEKTTQDKIDDDYNENIDSEIEKLEEERDLLLESLEEKFSEANIAKMVADVLTTGFIELNNEMLSIQDVLLDSINNSVDGYSVMADVIKNELVANLNVALDTMRQLENISDSLGLQNYPILNASAIELTQTPSYEEEKSNKTFTIGDTYLNINGNVSEDIIADIEELINQKNDEMLNKITSNL